ncbi:uncharacterized protein LOC129723608 [Wyeomyia smithii]|uniref:uncharacterized protein LOC129723608 n=1 Tax=Wyeomyia smithii TaxID=174621 RepID=UPI00246809BD|nr:uncharacterized protein LOC129723608 [Wyeomyia smithii]
MELLLLSYSLITAIGIRVTRAQGSNLAADHGQLFLDHLDPSDHVYILHSILKEYSYARENWTVPESEQYDQKVVSFLQKYADSTLDNEVHQHDVAGSRFSVRIFTNYCGPGNWSPNGEVTQNPYFTKIDQCCKSHDECPSYVVQQRNYENFPGLPFKPQIFSRLRCSCDVQFFSCLRNVGTFFSYAVAWIYSKVQLFCFEYEFPVVECKQLMIDGWFSFPRCADYLVNNTAPKSWQWFNIPYLSEKQRKFPNITNLYEGI